MDPRGLRVTQNAYFSLLTHTKKLSLVTFCDTIVGIGASFWTHGWTDTEGWTDMEVEIVRYRTRANKGRRHYSEIIF